MVEAKRLVPRIIIAISLADFVVGFLSPISYRLDAATRGVVIESSKTLDQKAFPLGLGVRRSSNIARFGVDDKGSSYESYAASGGAVKAVVGGLTALVNTVMRKDDEVEDVDEDRKPLTVAELRDGIEGDYTRCYLWTGDIDPLLYDARCTFTDPTLSFKGLKTFQKNLANLRPIIDRFVKEYSVDLYSCVLDETRSEVNARWRMVGTLALPWRPKIDLVGKTRFRYDGGKGNRIVDYFETWETPAAEVLLNLLKPGGE